MSHYVKVLNGIVVDGIVAEPEFFDTFIDSSPGEWIQTSYNTHGGQHPENRPLRMNYAGIGYTYDRINDRFIPPQPFKTWILNEETCLWESPIEYPSDGNHYYWSDDAYLEDNTTGWIVIPQ